MKTIHFSFGGQLCIETLDGDEIEVEIGPERYRALYGHNWRPRVTEIIFERNDARIDKPDYWVPAEIPLEVERKVIDQINAELEEERQRLASMADA